MSKPTYRGFVRLNNGKIICCSDCFDTRREALVDAANLIRAANKDNVPWKSKIDTYGTSRDV